MSAARLLVVGDLPQLETALLQQGHTVRVSADPVSALQELEKGWFNLVLVQLVPDWKDNRSWLDLIETDEDVVPRMFVTSNQIDSTGAAIRQALTGRLGRPPRAVAFVSEAEGPEAILDAVDTTLSSILTTDSGLLVRVKLGPGETKELRATEALRELAGSLWPERNHDAVSDELQSLFRKLFRDCTEIRVEHRSKLGGRGMVANLWITPFGPNIPEGGHLLLVKCGDWRAVERIRRAYEQYYFRITPFRPSGWERTTHFGAFAFPLPYNQPPVDRRFYEYVRDGDVTRLKEMLVNLLKDFESEWYWQTGIPSDPRVKDFRGLCTERFGIADIKKLSEEVAELVQEVAPRLNITIRDDSEPEAHHRKGLLGFVFNQSRPLYYPDPVQHLDEAISQVVSAPQMPLRITHGDLRSTNLRVGPKDTILVDGHENLAWGPYLTDVASLETLLKFECLEGTSQLSDFYELEKKVLLPTKFTAKILGPTQPLISEVSKVMSLIAHLRTECGKRLSDDHLKEYYVLLLFMALREIKRERRDPGAADVHRLHALLSAAMICHRLENWGEWKTWKEPEQPKPKGGAPMASVTGAIGKLSGEQLRRFREALADAFRDWDDLGMLLRDELDKKLYEISSKNKTHLQNVNDVIQAAEGQGWIPRLVDAARRNQPEVAEFFALAQELGIAPATRALETILSKGGDFYDIAVFRNRIQMLEHQVCRIELKGKPVGTGFLVGTSAIMTNYHVVQKVIEQKENCAPGDIVVRFDYWLQEDGITINPGVEHKLADNWHVDSSPYSLTDLSPHSASGQPSEDELDYAILRLQGEPAHDSVGKVGGRKRDYIKLPEPGAEFEWQKDQVLFIMQHPKGRPLKLTVNRYLGLNSNGTRVTYRNDTDEGSSGSPCLTADLSLVALHHSGDPNYYLPEHNQGIPISNIVRLLKARGVLDAIQ